MSDKAFLDTNIFVYANDLTDPRKQSVALGLIRTATIDWGAVVSYQVVHEFFNVVLVKSQRKMPHEEARRYLDTIFRSLQVVPSSFDVISDAIRIQDRFRVSWYDSLIVAAAQQSGCSLLYSEDFQHGQRFGGVTVRDPFR